MSKRRGWLLTVWAVGLVLPFASLASPGELDPATGRVVALEGAVKINGKLATVGQVIQRGDKIDTGKKGTISVRLPNAAFRATRSTKLTIAELVSKASRLRVKAGRVLSAVIPDTKYEVESPVVVAAVRGTTFFVEVQRATQTYVCVCTGTLELRDLLTRGPRQVLSATHHAANLVKQRGDVNTYESAGMLNHTDKEVEEVESYLRE